MSRAALVAVPAVLLVACAGTGSAPAELNLATVSSVLVECANLRNPADAALARSPEGQERFARALAAAIG